VARSGTDAWTATAQPAPLAGMPDGQDLGSLIWAVVRASSGPEVARAAAGGVAALLGGAGVAVFVREDPDRLVLAARRPAQGASSGLGGPLSTVVAACGPFLRGLERRPGPRQIRQVAVEPVVGELVTSSGLQEGWLVPLVSGGRSQGVLLVGPPRRFERSEPPASTGALAGLGAVVALALERVALAASLQERRVLDRGTGLVSSQAFAWHGATLAAEVARGEAQVAVLWFQLATPGGSGEPLGVDLVAKTAGVLRRVVRGGDVVGRLGDQSFGVLARQVGSAAQAEALAGRVAAALEAVGSSWSGAPSVRCQAGWALLQPGEDLAGALARAEARAGAPGAAGGSREGVR
jgi:GGDEF domain-containing protein